jgi:hypothetical protein
MTTRTSAAGERRRRGGAALAVAGVALVTAWQVRPVASAPVVPWPHEPAGLRVVADQSWDRLGGRWKLLWGNARIDSAADAPGSPPAVLRIDFPEGFIGGSAPGTEAFEIPRTRTLYAGFWWQASDPWDGHPSNSNKLAYIFADPHGSMSLMMYGTPGGPYELRVFPDWHGEWLRPNMADVPVTLGVWHRVEWLVIEGAPGAPDNGFVRWWLDGTLVGSHTGVRLAEGPMTEFRLAPVWGGAETVPKRSADHFLYDHTRLSVR